MAVPKRKTSKARRDNRRSHHALKKIELKKCSKCGQLTIPHSRCKNCNNYIK